MGHYQKNSMLPPPSLLGDNVRDNLGMVVALLSRGDGVGFRYGCNRGLKPLGSSPRRCHSQHWSSDPFRIKITGTDKQCRAAT